uniref:Uncharacterized protein n=1 Tax=Glossina austeni TaxID=7395 RepID=A0A1A9UGH9_GLOAU
MQTNGKVYRKVPGAFFRLQPELSVEAPVQNFEGVHMDTWRQRGCIYEQNVVVVAAPCPDEWTECPQPEKGLLIEETPGATLHLPKKQQSGHTVGTQTEWPDVDGETNVGSATFLIENSLDADSEVSEIQGTGSNKLISRMNGHVKEHREAEVVQPGKWLEDAEERKIVEAPVELSRAARTLVAKVDKANRGRHRVVEREMFFEGLWYQLTIMRDGERYSLRLLANHRLVTVQERTTGAIEAKTLGCTHSDQHK